MVTAQNLIDQAYRKIGLISPTSTENSNALESVNNMLSLWGTEFLVPYKTRESFTMTVGKAEYTIGSGGDFDTVRPISISSGFFVDDDNYSFPITKMSEQEYNNIGSKTLDGRPTRFYYIGEYSLGKIIFNKETAIAYTVYFEFWKNFTEFAALETTVALPNEYKDAIVYNLAVRLAENNSIVLPVSVARTAAISLALISRLSAINRVVPPAKFDFSDGSLFDIVTGE